MRRLHLLVEGQTEELVVQCDLQRYLERMGWIVTVSILSTKRPAGGGKFRGGVAKWDKVRKEIRLLLRSCDVVTTIIDYYAFPQDAPGMSDRPAGDCYPRVRHVEQAIAADIDDARFVPHLVLHELETWVLAGADFIGGLVGDREVADRLRAVVAEAGGPELVNDGPATAPSKRIRDQVPGYQKTLHGPLVIGELGFDELRAQCPHLGSWLTRLDALAQLTRV
jgi:hypothetical protein